MTQRLIDIYLAYKRTNTLPRASYAVLEYYEGKILHKQQQRETK